MWFAFKLVSLNHWKQPLFTWGLWCIVVICFQISIFEPLETAGLRVWMGFWQLWFAFKLVSLNHWKQLIYCSTWCQTVVICFQISIFEPLETAFSAIIIERMKLWFAFKLVSLNHWKQPKDLCSNWHNGCDLLSN